MQFSDLARLASGHVEARVIHVAVHLGVFDALQDGSKEAATLARTIHADMRATELFLNALVALDLLEKKGDLFSLAEVSSTYLVRSSPKYFGDMILFESSSWPSWGSLERAVRSGKPVRTADMYQEDPEDTERFIRAMDSLVRARGDAEIVTRVVDLSGIREFLDLGSGPGTYPIYFCRKYSSLRATIFDLPGTMKVTERFIRQSGLGDRIRLITGDYRLDPIPGTYQMIFLSNVIHAESGEQNAALMAKLFPCLEPGGKIVIKDHILDETLTHPPVGALFALLMLLTTEKGRCYSFEQIRGWLEQAGFRQVAQIVLPPPLSSSLVIGKKSTPSPPRHDRIG